jgi:hypothetical protein
VDRTYILHSDITQLHNLSPFWRNNIQNWVQKNTVLLRRGRNYNRLYSTLVKLLIDLIDENIANAKTERWFFVTAELALFQKRDVWCSPAWKKIYGNKNRFLTDRYSTTAPHKTKTYPGFIFLLKCISKPQLF